MSILRRKAVFLDRDGVLNQAVVRNGKPYPPQTLSELEVLPGVPLALQRLKAAGFVLVVVTNQPDVARGTQRREVVESINDTLLEQLPLDACYTCYDDGDSPERKPNPGLLLKAARLHTLDLPGSYMVGDRWRDIEAGRRAGCRTLFVDRGYQERQPDSPDWITDDLLGAAAWILRDRSEVWRECAA